MAILAISLEFKSVAGLTSRGLTRMSVLTTDVVKTDQEVENHHVRSCLLPPANGMSEMTASAVIS